MIACILTHIRYPESAYLGVGVTVEEGIDVSEAISQALPHNNAGVLRPFQRTRELTIRLDRYSSIFSTDKSTIRCWHWDMENSSQELSRSIRKILENVGKGAVALSIEAEDIDLTGKMWELFLHGLPRLERVRWCGKERSPGVADPFISAFLGGLKEDWFVPG